jgi:hypothetical protein
MTLKSDQTDEVGVRHIEIQTDVTVDGNEGYDAAERQAKEWFFVNYDERAKLLAKRLALPIVLKTVLDDGYLDPTWLQAPHPVIVLGGKEYMFGHHTGINPTATQATWGFHFEVLPVRGRVKATMKRRRTL